MNLTRNTNGQLELALTAQEAKNLAQDIIHHAEDAQTTVLNLGYLLREANYETRYAFRQPPHAWDNEHRLFPSTRTH
jgi:hypothetical protein